MKVHEEFTTKVQVALTTFEVEGYHRDWNPPPGYTPPKGTVWVVQTYCFNQKVVARGDTKAKALKQLEQYLRRHGHV